MSRFLFVDFGRIGGVAETVATVATELERRGHQVTVLAAEDGPVSPDEFARRTTGPAPPERTTSPILRWARLGWRMYRTVSRTRPRPDLVAIEGRRVPPLVLAIAARMRHRSVVLVSPHNLSSKRSRGLRGLDEIMIRAACRLAHAVILFDVPPAEAGAYGRKALAVPLPPPFGSLCATTTSTGVSAGPVPRVGTPGHIRGDKGVVSFAGAVARSDLQISYEIRGLARDQAAVAQLLAIDDDRIVTVPLDVPMTSQQFYEYLSGFDVIVLPYRRVTASAVLQSALAFGVPVAAFPFPSARAAAAEGCAVFTAQEMGNDADLLAVLRCVLDQRGTAAMAQKLDRGVEVAHARVIAAADCYESQAPSSNSTHLASLGDA